jgi:hypothetical protein
MLPVTLLNIQYFLLVLERLKIFTTLLYTVVKLLEDRWQISNFETAISSAASVRIEAIEGMGSWRGGSLPQPTRGAGEHRELPQRSQGRSPGRERFWCILGLKNDAGET